MMGLRIALAAALLLQAVSSGLPLLAFVAYRIGLIHPTIGAAARMTPLWAATPAWQLAVWLAGILAVLAAAVRLVLFRPALAPYVAGVGVNVALQQVMQRSDAYRQVFGSALSRFDYARLAILLLLAALIWWVEQQPRRPRQGTPV